MSGNWKDDTYVLSWPNFTDGTPSKWPGPPLVNTDSNPTAKNWLQKTGQAIATVLGLEGKI